MLKNKIALVTGASSGIGRAVALVWAREAKALVDATVAHFGRLDVACNNAGIPA